MQTVLGSGGQIADELARALREFTDDIRLVSRHPRRVNDADDLVQADLMDAAATAAAVAGSDVAYLTVGLPMDSDLWETRFPVMMANTIAACEEHGAKLVFFDNTYMYAGTAAPQTEETPSEPGGRKGRVRAEIARAVLSQMAAGRIDALICRAPEFYGPGKTQSLTNSLVFSRIKAGRWPLIPVSSRTRRTLIWTPDASRAMALLGNTPDAFGKTWHLPCDSERLTYAGMIEIASQVTGRRIRSLTIPGWVVRLAGLVSPAAREVAELLPRYRQDNVFDSSAFLARFPTFAVTPYRVGITRLLAGATITP